MKVGKFFFGKTGRGLAVAAAILAAIGLTTVPRPADAGGGWGGGGISPVPLSGLGSVLSPSAPCTHNPTIIRTTPRTATMAPTHLPQLTIRPRVIIRPH